MRGFVIGGFCLLVGMHLRDVACWCFVVFGFGGFDWWSLLFWLGVFSGLVV